MNESKYILELHLNRFEHNKEDNPIEPLLINQEVVELYISGNTDEFWITNKRIIAYHLGARHGFLFDAEINQYTSFKYSNIFSISVDFINSSRENRINLIFNNDVQLHLMIHEVLPITDITQALSDKIF